MGSKAKPPLGRDEARDAAIDFTAVAAAEEHVLFARYGDSPELVSPKDRPGYNAVQALVGAGRHVATMLRRYAEGRAGRTEVDAVLRCVGVRRSGMGARLDEVLRTGWREEWIAADISGLLREVLQGGE